MRSIEYSIGDSDERALERLRRTTGTENDRELIDTAITLLEWAVEQIGNDRKIASLDPKTKSYRVLQMQALQHARIRRAA